MGKHGDFDYQYNAQISVDSDTQVIVGQHVSQNANDKQELEPALQQMQTTTGQLPKQLSADNGYQSGSNLAAICKDLRTPPSMVTLPLTRERKPMRLHWMNPNARWLMPTLLTIKQRTGFTVRVVRHCRLSDREKTASVFIRAMRKPVRLSIYSRCCKSSQGAAR